MKVELNHDEAAARAKPGTSRLPGRNNDRFDAGNHPGGYPGRAECSSKYGFADLAWTDAGSGRNRLDCW